MIMLRICCVRVLFKGLENIPSDSGNIIFASKHQSHVDGVLLLIKLHGSIFFMKKQILKVPVVSFYMRKTGMFILDRENSLQSVRKMMEFCENFNGSLVIFPEGRRTNPKEKLNKYKPGIYMLYDKLKATVVPIGLNSGTICKSLFDRKKPGDIIIEFGKPINSGLKKGEFMEVLYNSIEDLSQRLLL